jgi:hypothetical protein
MTNGKRYEKPVRPGDAAMEPEATRNQSPLLCGQNVAQRYRASDRKASASVRLSAGRAEWRR